MWLLNEARFAIKFNFFSQPLRQRRTDGGEEEGEEAEEEERESHLTKVLKRVSNSVL